MKKIAFINSHLFSGSLELYQALSDSIYIQGCRTDRQKIYLNNQDFLQLLNQKHKINSNEAIYLDEIYYNYAFSTKIDCSKFYFIHLIRSPKCLNYILEKEKINPIFVIRRYLYRLRRICELAKKTPRAIFLTFEDLQDNKSINLIKELLSLEDNFTIKCNFHNQEPKELIPYKLMKETEESYEKYLFFLKQLKLN